MQLRHRRPVSPGVNTVGLTMSRTGIAALLISLATLSAVAAEGEKGQISETSIDEISNTKGGGAAAVDKAFKELDKGGVKTQNRTEILGRLVGAAYCAQAEAVGAAFTICVYDDAAQVEKGKPKRAAMFGEKNAEHLNRAMVLSIPPADDEKQRKAAKKLADLFTAIGKPSAKQPKESK